MSKPSKAAKRHQNSPGRTGTQQDVARVLRQAQGALAAGQVDAACQILVSAREARSNAEGSELLAAASQIQAFERWDKPVRAVASIERAIEAAPADAGLIRLRGTLLRRAGRLRAALPILKEAHRLAPGDQSLAAEVLLAQLAAGERDLPLSPIADVVQSPMVTLVAGIRAAAGGNLPKSQQVLAGIEQPIAGLIRAIVRLAHGEPHSAIPALRQSAADARLPGQARAYASFYLGLAQMRRRDLKSAVEALERAMDLGLSEELVAEHLVWTYNQLVIDAVLDNQLGTAADWLWKVVELDGPAAEVARQNVAYVLSLYGQEKANAGEYGEAARHWERALEIKPRDFVLRQNLAVALERADRGDEAIPHWHELAQRVVKAGAKTAKGQRDNGSTAQEDEALSRHIRAVAHRHLADLYVEEDDYERAIAQLERALEAVPDDADSRHELARLFVCEGEPRKALPHLERVIAERPDWVEALTHLGDVHTGLGEYDAAVAALEQAYALAPDYPGVRISLGTAIAQRTIEVPATMTALDDARRAVGLLPRGRVDGLIAVGIAQLAQGKRSQAATTFRKCVREARDKVLAQVEVGRAYWKAGEPKLAVAAWEKVMKAAKRDPHLFPLLAIEWARAGDVDRCKECFREALSRGLLGSSGHAADRMSQSPEGKKLLLRVLRELIPEADGLGFQAFLAEELLNRGDIAAARDLLNAMALQAVEADDGQWVYFALNIDLHHRNKLLDRKTFAIAADWAETHRYRDGDDDED